MYDGVALCELQRQTLLRSNAMLVRYAKSMSALLVAVCLAPLPCAQADPNHARLERTIRLKDTSDKHVPVITAIAIQPNGNLLATAGDDHIVRLWDIQTGKLVRQLRGHRDWVTAVSFCGDGQELVTGCRDRRVLVWDVATGRLKGALGEHKHPITAIVVSQVRDKVAIAGFRAPLKIYDLATGKLQGSLECPCTDIRAVQFSPNMHYLAAGGRQGDLRIWDLTTGKSVDVTAHQRRIRSVVFTEDSRQLVTAGEDQKICISRADSGELQHRIPVRAGKVLSMAMLESHHVAVASADNMIRIFQLDGEKPFAILKGHTGSIAGLAARGRTLISGSFDTTVRMWTVFDGNQPGGDRRQGDQSDADHTAQDEPSETTLSTRRVIPTRSAN